MIFQYLKLAKNAFSKLLNSWFTSTLMNLHSSTCLLRAAIFTNVQPSGSPNLLTSNKQNFLNLCLLPISLILNPFLISAQLSSLLGSLLSQSKKFGSSLASKMIILPRKKLKSRKKTCGLKKLGFERFVI